MVALPALKTLPALAPAPPFLVPQEELERLQPGVVIERVAPPPPQQSSQRSYGQQAVGRLLGQTPPAPLIPASEAAAAAAAAAANSIPGQPRQEELTGVWEVLSLDQEGRPFLDRWVGGGWVGGWV
jgi:hypothetical protein